MAVHEFTQQLKKYITARLNEPNDAIIVTGMPAENDRHDILVMTSYAAFKVPRPGYQTTFQTYLHRDPPGPGEGFIVNGNRPVDVSRQLQQWEELKKSCRDTAYLTPYLVETFASGKGKHTKQLRLLWADPHTIWIDTDILNTVDVRWGEMKAAATDKAPVYFQSANIEAFFLPWNRWKEYERSDNALLAQEAALAKAWWHERKKAGTRQG